MVKVIIVLPLCVVKINLTFFFYFVKFVHFANFVFMSFHFLGGGSLFAIHSECEVYNPRTDKWSTIAPMNWRRSRSGVTGLRRLLYVVGG